MQIADEKPICRNLSPALLTKREFHASVHQRKPDVLRDVRKDFNDDELDAIVILRGRLARVNLIIGEVDACSRGLNEPAQTRPQTTGDARDGERSCSVAG